MKSKSESAKINECILTIDEIDCSSVVEEHQIISYCLNDIHERIRIEKIFRKYYLRSPFPRLIGGTFEIVRDHETICKCYMTDDRMRLIEC